MPIKTCAIVGSHPLTRDDAPYDRPYIDIWLFNERLAKIDTESKPIRCNAVFQMHQEEIWKNPTNRNDPNHHQWLQKKHDFPIYMMDQYAEVPSSVRYPLEDICKALLPKFRRGKEQPIRYFTSSVAYAIALAIYQGYERIHLIGVEMETQTEYEYQRDGVFFWLGVAIGKGIEVIVHEKSRLFDAPLYGYEGDVTLHRADFEKRMAELGEKHELVRQRLEAASKMQETALQRMNTGEGDMAAMTQVFFRSIKEQAQASVDYGALEGAIDENKRYLGKAEAMIGAAGGNLFSRQEFEQSGSKAGELAAKFEGAMHQKGGMAETMWKLLSEGVKAGALDLEKRVADYSQAHAAYLDMAYRYGRMIGAYQENIQFLKKVDSLIKAAGGSKSEEVLLAARSLEGRSVVPGCSPEADFAQVVRAELPAPSAIAEVAE